MADYDDLFDLINDEGFRGKVDMCTTEICVGITTEPNSTLYHRQRYNFAKRVLDNFEESIKGIIAFVLIDNKALSKPQIEGIDDIALKSSIESFLDTVILTGV